MGYIGSSPALGGWVQEEMEKKKGMGMGMGLPK